MVILLGSLGLDAVSITFQAHHPKGALGSHQSTLPCSNDAFSTVQLPLPSEELLL
jgi:hypothetical protein